MDLAQLVTFLNGLGPWGVLAGAVLVIVVQRLRAKGSETPLLDATLNLIRAKHENDTAPTPAPVSKDIDHETVSKLIG